HPSSPEGEKSSCPEPNEEPEAHELLGARRAVVVPGFARRTLAAPAVLVQIAVRGQRGYLGADRCGAKRQPGPAYDPGPHRPWRREGTRRRRGRRRRRLPLERHHDGLVVLACAELHLQKEGLVAFGLRPDGDAPGVRCEGVVP